MTRLLALFALAACSAQPAPAHDPEPGKATAIRNEGVIVEADGRKILFDPIYDNHFEMYHEVPEALSKAIANGNAPYDGVDAVFVTHAHGDHFSPSGLVARLAAQPYVRLFVPAQAVAAMRADANWQDAFEARVEGIDAGFGEMATYALGETRVQALGVPHAGWPARHRDLQHYVYRIDVTESARVMHLGDASHDDQLYEPHAETLASDRTGIAFVPYWMLLDEGGRAMIEGRLNAEHVVGIHVPTDVPAELRASGEDFFSILGETRDIPDTHAH
ncbi:MBL fold metallo-hydrolase [Sphingomicrobium clamense]|uniref:MBL fold metallo-hydrolase n=1 Tax=Sphingomicrobium clamense TaxID=2851013 RepID=A0ABS6V4M5_9SPHN|nr:MBL fold metallo-hydrolase [Sphingomicrobium sp. B8]MBW0144038.1 MBL fold metallo-hydrolase [Sphingomicrobium sp. B8]